MKKSKEKEYKMFENGKFNPNYPRNYNFLLGRVDATVNNAEKKLLFNIEIIKQK